MRSGCPHHVTYHGEIFVLRVWCFVSTIFVLASAGWTQEITHAQGEIAGEVTTSSAILQSRLTSGSYPFEDDVPGSPGVAQFEIADNPEFEGARYTEWLEASAESDFVVKTKVSGLRPATRYYYRLVFGANRDETERGPVRSFTTLQGAEGESPVSFVVVTGLSFRNFDFHYKEEDKALGFPALETIREMSPDFMVFTGDNVYYDVPMFPRGKTQYDLRKKWHEQFVRPRFVDLFAEVPTYWMKDDHDFRYNDADRSSDLPPSPELGISTFVEQAPVVDPADRDAKTYRTHRIGRDLQIWLVEGRDYRSPMLMENGPEKTLWGFEQRQWLMDTVLASDATFKILVSPTPMIGPDDARMPGPPFEGQDRLKRDNHADDHGYSYERDLFFDFLLENKMLEKHFYVVCGDRHWQYHSISPEGVEEFSCGAIIDENSRLGRQPGDPDSNDPEGKIRQPYTMEEVTGGFLRIETSRTSGKPVLTFTFHDEFGETLYRVVKTAGADSP